MDERRKTSDGRIGIYDSDTKEFKRWDDNPVQNPSWPVRKGAGMIEAMMGPNGRIQSPWGKAFSTVQRPTNALGQAAAEKLGGMGHPVAGAFVGTGIQMLPDIALSLGGGEAEQGETPTLAKSFARRALGFPKRMLKSPFARKTANEAADVALREGVIPRAGSGEVEMERAEGLRDKSAQGMSDSFQRAYQWVEGKNPFMKNAPKVGGVMDAVDENATKSLPLKTPAINAPTVRDTPAQAPDFNERGRATVFEKNARIFDPRQLSQRINSLRPKFFGGHWNDEHAIIDKAQATLRGMGRQKLTLEDANLLKTKLQSLAKYGEPGWNIAKSLAYQVRDTIDKGLDSFAQQIGDPKLASDFMKHKYNDAAASRMMESLNDKLAAEEGNMAVSLPSLVVGSGRMMAGDVRGGLAQMGGVELAKRRGAAVLGRGLYSAANATARRGPGLTQAILSQRRGRSKREDDENSDSQ